MGVVKGAHRPPCPPQPHSHRELGSFLNNYRTLFAISKGFITSILTVNVKTSIWLFYDGTTRDGSKLFLKAYAAYEENLVWMSKIYLFMS